ncbi:uncharacterized protein LOC111518894 [Drosophila willistoni]|uniref:uncharacterized protein LOC111518894 n=1 Tax=Drosophila willistoni TaxID=7260 RepID=UPI000C26D039|nr:uncharacterized protein LOC111518894 [Drosophila willistoni]
MVSLMALAISILPHILGISISTNDGCSTAPNAASWIVFISMVIFWHDCDLVPRKFSRLPAAARIFYEMVTCALLIDIGLTLLRWRSDILLLQVIQVLLTVMRIRDLRHGKWPYGLIGVFVISYLIALAILGFVQVAKRAFKILIRFGLFQHPSGAEEREQNDNDDNIINAAQFLMTIDQCGMRHFFCHGCASRLNDTLHN